MNYIEELQERLDIKSNAELQEQMEADPKYDAMFRGLRMLDIQSIVHKWYFEFRLESTLSLDEQKQLALDIFREKYTEDKIAGIVFLQELLLPAGAIEWEADLPRFASLFIEGCISDWNVCDWFCVKVLCPLVEQHGKVCAEAIAKWSKSDNLLQQRAAGVAFADIANKGDGNFPGFMDMMFAICSETIRFDAGFSRTGTGWLLNDMSYADAQKVSEFIEANLCGFSREGLYKATENIPDETKLGLRNAYDNCS